MVTWVYENNSFVPIAKIVDNKCYSVVSDYIGRPIQAYDKNGEKVWSCDYDIYGNVRNLKGDRSFIPFRQLGQYEDEETGLYYNRFRYYDPNIGTYISKDPISILGGLNVYAYVKDVNSWIDVFGLDWHHIIPNKIYNNYSKYFDKIVGYEQNQYKTKPNNPNLKNLDKPFHGNHPAYSEYVESKVVDMIANEKFNLKNITKLQDEMNILIDDALENYTKTGMNLNDYFKSEKYLEFLKKNKNKFEICK